MATRLFDSTAIGKPEEAVEFITNLLESSTEYSIIAKDLDGKILLPRADGFEMLARIRRDPKTRDARVVAVTAMAMVGDRQKILDAGFDGYIPKPIGPESLLQQVEAFLAEELRAIPSEDAPSRPAVVATPRTSTGRLVLTVDNNEASLRWMESALAGGGHDVLTARGGRQALEQARRRTPDLIITDVHMPEGDAYELLPKLKSDPDLAPVPVIVVSMTRFGEHQPDRLVELGALRYETGPLEPARLLELVDEALGGDGAER